MHKILESVVFFVKYKSNIISKNLLWVHQYYWNEQKLYVGRKHLAK